MSFWPLPTSLLEILREAHRCGPIVDLGAGDGALARHLRSIGIETILLDACMTARPWSGVAIEADLRALPFRTRTIEAALLANVLRHARPADLRRIVTEIDWSLRSAARLVVLEDLPTAQSQSARNYRRTLDLLARRDPSRGAALAPETLAPVLEKKFPVLELEGTGENQVEVKDPERPLRWLQARASGSRDRELERLVRDVRKAGMSYGPYWYRVYRRHLG